jgi:hypothetical protein
LKNEWRQWLKGFLLSKKRLRWLDVRDSTSSGESQGGLFFSDEMISNFILAFDWTLLQLFFFIINLLMIPVLHFDREVTTFVLSDEFNRVTVLIFGFEIAQVRNTVPVPIKILIFV